MIRLSNGFEFKYACASGALGFDGRGYWWERPFITPRNLVIITKTLTLLPRLGNYRWWKPWETFNITKDFTVNALGLPNPSESYWIENIYPRIKHPNIIPSICPFNADEARIMTLALNGLNIRAIEINISCPNTVEMFDPIAIIETALVHTKHPILVTTGRFARYSAIAL